MVSNIHAMCGTVPILPKQQSISLQVGNTPIKAVHANNIDSTSIRQCLVLVCSVAVVLRAGCTSIKPPATDDVAGGRGKGPAGAAELAPVEMTRAAHAPTRRIASRGYGPAFPVAGDAADRQLNRRAVNVLPEEGAAIPARC